MLLYFCPIVLVVGILLYIVYRINHPPVEKRLNNFLGPKPHFLLGHAYMFSKVPAEITATMMKICKDYESPVKLKLGPIIIVYIYKAEHIQAVLSNPVNIRKTAVDYELLIKEWLGNGLLNSTGDLWRMRRKLLTPAFNHEMLHDSVAVINEQATILVHVLREQANKWQPFNIAPLLSSCAIDIISETALGKNVGAQSGPGKEYVLAQSEATQLIFKRIWNPLIWLPFIYYKTPDGKCMAKALKILHDFTKKCIKERQLSGDVKESDTPDDVANASTAKRTTYLDILMDLKENGQLTDQDVKDELDTFIFTGHDKAAYGMMWVIYCLGRHPHIQQRVRDELQTVLGSSTSIEMEHLNVLKYLECCIKEAMRIYPAVPVIARTVEHDISIDADHMVPAGTVVWMNLLAMHRDPNSFPDPMTFDPERFMVDSSVENPSCYLPFSAGPRNCIGEKFALMDIKIVVGQIVRDFVIHAVHSQEEMVESFKLILSPENGIVVELTPV